MSATWVVDNNNGPHGTCVIRQEREDGHYKAICECCGASPERERNARLIAAAPELLAALLDLRAELHAHFKFNVRKHYSLMVADSVASKLLHDVGP